MSKIKLVPVTESLIEEAIKNNAEWEARVSTPKEKLIEIPFIDNKLNKCSVTITVPENCSDLLLAAKLENVIVALKYNYTQEIVTLKGRW